MSLSSWFKRIAKRWKTQKVVVGTCLIELEQKFREIAAIHITGAKNHTFNAEWLGWGKGQTMFLAVYISHSVGLPEEELHSLAQLISSALAKLKVLHSVVHEFRSAPPSREEYEQSVMEMRDFLEPMGMTITVDEEKRTMTQSRIPGADIRPFTKTDPLSLPGRWKPPNSSFEAIQRATRFSLKAKGSISDEANGFFTSLTD